MLGELLQVFGPDGRVGELLLEGGEPGIVEFNFAALDELPGACVVGSFLDGVVDVAERDGVFDFVVEDRLERAYDLPQKAVSGVCNRCRRFNFGSVDFSRGTYYNATNVEEDGLWWLC